MASRTRHRWRPGADGGAAAGAAITGAVTTGVPPARSRSSASRGRDSESRCARRPLRSTSTVLRAGAWPLCRSSCKQPIVRSARPSHSRRVRLVLQPKHRVEAQPARHARHESRRRTPAACANRRLWSAQYAVSRNAFAGATSGDARDGAVSSPADPDASRDCARSGPSPAASSPG